MPHGGNIFVRNEFVSLAVSAVVLPEKEIHPPVCEPVLGNVKLKPVVYDEAMEKVESGKPVDFSDGDNSNVHTHICIQIISIVNP